MFAGVQYIICPWSWGCLCGRGWLIELNLQSHDWWNSRLQPIRDGRKPHKTWWFPLECKLSSCHCGILIRILCSSWWLFLSEGGKKGLGFLLPLPVSIFCNREVLERNLNFLITDFIIKTNCQNQMVKGKHLSRINLTTSRPLLHSFLLVCSNIMILASLFLKGDFHCWQMYGSFYLILTL